MAARLMVCSKCRSYSLRDACPACSGRMVSPHPARFSPEDRFGVYRRRLKRLDEQRRKEAAVEGGSGGV